jgi:superfamily II DNA or RNA helicase
MIQLRDYQSKTIEGVQSLFEKGVKSVLIILFMGLGKMVIAAKIIHMANAKNKRILFIAHRTFLIEEIMKKLEILGVKCGVIKAGFKEDRLQKVQIASIQTLGNRNLPMADVVIIDEAHHAISAEYMKVIEKYKASGAYIIGMTATYFLLSSKRGLCEVFDDYVNTIQVPEALEKGYLIESKVFHAKSLLDMSAVKKTAGDFNVTQMHKAFSTKNVEINLINKYHTHVGNKRAIVFCVNKDHCKEVSRALSEAGYKGSYVIAETSEEERLEKLAKLESGEYTYITNCQIYTEGFDSPLVEATVLVYETMSKAKYFQSASRAGRPLPGDINLPIDKKKKPFYTILDMGSNTHRFGCVEQPFDISLEPRGKDKEGVAPLRDCPNCGRMLAVQIRVCPECQFEMPVSPKTKKEIKEEEFVELNKKRMSVAPYLRLPANRYNEIPSDLLETFAKEKGFKQPKGWANHILLARGEGKKKVKILNYDEPDYHKQCAILRKGYFDKTYPIDSHVWQFIEETDKEAIFEYKLAKKETVL